MPKRKQLLFIAPLLFFFGHILYITIDGLHDEPGKADAIVVFGNKIHKNGLPSKRLAARLRRAAELYHQGFASHVIVSGGIDKRKLNEAKEMAAYLRKQQVADGDIIEDASGYTTYLTAKAVKKIFKQKGFHSVILVSQFYHLSRCKLAFSKFGFTKILSARAKFFELRDIYSLLREVFAFYRYLWHDYG